uniref:DUF4371 domain-containing protein n=1 Tax=Brassica oleracea var. oleracea TaxID=109376 RepID=A0A0D3BKF9_BRAOL
MVGGSDEFVTKGFDTWKNPKRLGDHVGQVNSFHNNAMKMADNLMNQDQYLLRQGLPFRGHDESMESANKGNFVELLKYTATQNELVSKVVLENAPKNNQMSADVSTKEQVAVVFRFVDKKGAFNSKAGTTRWGSHYKHLLRLADLFTSIIKVLEHVERDGSDGIKRCHANGLLRYFHTFDFVFYLQFMLLLLGLTNNLSMALQRKDQDILNAMSLVKSTKQQLYKLRDNGYNSIIGNVNSFCEKNKTELLIMEEEFVNPKKPRQRSNITN